MMAMGFPVKVLSTMTIEQFKLFVEDQPEHLKWELIDGVAILNPTPTNFHQMIQNNVQFELTLAARAQGDLWHVCPGTSVVVSQALKPNAPAPDIMVRFGDALRTSYIEDAVLVVEVISPSSRTMDLKRKPMIYGALPSIQHYLVIDTRSASVHVWNRAAGWVAEEFTDLSAVIRLDAVHATLEMRSIYRLTGLAPR
jgi:Uma2 family endonuclease